MLLTPEHDALRRTVAGFVEKEINPYVAEWETAGSFPAREIFKKLGDLGLLGITKPKQFGGLDLDYSYEVVFSEELGAAELGGVPMAIGVQTDMATPALSKFGSDELRERFLRPAIAGEIVCSVAVSEPHAGSDVAAIKSTGHQDVDYEFHPVGYSLRAREYLRWRSTQEQVVGNRADGPARHHFLQTAGQVGNALFRYCPGLFRQGSGAPELSHRRRRRRIQAANDAISGGTPVRSGELSEKHGELRPEDH
jgi:hypothetical protein